MVTILSLDNDLNTRHIFYIDHRAQNSIPSFILVLGKVTTKQRKYVQSHIYYSTRLMLNFNIEY